MAPTATTAPARKTAGKTTTGTQRGRPRKEELASPPSEFGTILKDFRRGRGLSQAELAKRSKISTGYVGMIETGLRGDRPSLPIIERLAEALRLNTQEKATLAAAAGIRIPRVRGEAAELPLPPFQIFVDGLSELERSEKKLLNLMYDSFMEKRSG